MNTQLASKMGKAFCSGVLYARRKKLAFDEAKWITVKPNGPQHTGRPVLVDSATGEVLGGIGGKFNGRHISAVKQGGKFEQPGAQMQIIARNSAQKAAAMNNQRIDFKSVGAQTNKSEAQNANSLEVKRQEQSVEQEKAKTAKDFVKNKGWNKSGSGYYNPTDKQFGNMIGLELEYYKTGNIKTAILDGEYISNSSARRLLSAKDNTYLDPNGVLHVPDDIKNKIKPEYQSLILTPEQAETRKKANPNFRPLGSPVSVKDETDKAVLLEGQTGTYWMPKSQVVRENGLVTWVNKDMAQQKIKENSTSEKESASGVLGIPNASGWNRKIYTYKNGEKAVFINNKKIILNDEQYNKLKSLT